MSQVRISCRLEVLPGATSLEKILNAHSFGFEGIALPGRTRKDWLKDLLACAHELPLPLVSLSLGFEGSLLSPRPKLRQQCRDSLTRLLDVCAELKVGILNMPPVLIRDNPERVAHRGRFPTTTHRQDAMLLEQLPPLGDEAASRDVLILLEPVNRYESDYLHSVEHAARLCHELRHPSLGITADFFHMQIEELHSAGALSIAAPWIRHIHVAENTRVEPGPGSLDFSPGFTALNRSGYRGWIEVECRALSGPAEHVLPRSIKYLRNTWNAAARPPFAEPLP